MPLSDVTEYLGLLAPLLAFSSAPARKLPASPKFTVYVGDFSSDCCSAATPRVCNTHASSSSSTTHTTTTPSTTTSSNATTCTAPAEDRQPLPAIHESEEDDTDNDDDFSGFTYSSPTSTSSSSKPTKPSTKLFSYAAAGLPDPQLSVNHAMQPLPILLITDTTDESSFEFTPTDNFFPLENPFNGSDGDESDIVEEELLDPTEFWKQLSAWEKSCAAIAKAKAAREAEAKKKEGASCQAEKPSRSAMDLVSPDMVIDCLISQRPAQNPSLKKRVIHKLSRALRWTT